VLIRICSFPCASGKLPCAGKADARHKVHRHGFASPSLEKTRTTRPQARNRSGPPRSFARGASSGSSRWLDVLIRMTPIGEELPLDLAEVQSEQPDRVGEARHASRLASQRQFRVEGGTFLGHLRGNGTRPRLLRSVSLWRHCRTSAYVHEQTARNRSATDGIVEVLPGRRVVVERVTVTVARLVGLAGLVGGL